MSWHNNIPLTPQALRHQWPIPRYNDQQESPCQGPAVRVCSSAPHRTRTLSNRTAQLRPAPTSIHKHALGRRPKAGQTHEAPQKTTRWRGRHPESQTQILDTTMAGCSTQPESVAGARPLGLHLLAFKKSELSSFFMLTRNAALRLSS